MNQRRLEFYLVGGILCAKIALVFLVVFFLGNSSLLWSGDSLEYIDLGTNLIKGNGFARTIDGVIVPAHDRMPLYPLVVGFLYQLSGFHSFILVALLQAFCAAGIAFFTFRIARFFLSQVVACVIAILVVVEPISALLHLLVFPETLLLFFTSMFCYFLLRYLAEHQNRDLLISLAALLAATYTKPVAMYLLALPIIIFLIFGRARVARLIAVISVLSSIVLLPWVVRNHAMFGIVTLNTFGQKAFCGYQISAVFATAQGFRETSPGVAMIAVREFEEFTALEEQCHRSKLGALTMLVTKYPAAFLRVNTLVALGYLTNDGYINIFQNRVSALTIHHNYLTPAVFAGPDWRTHLIAAFSGLTWLQKIIVVVGRLFWIAVLGFACRGAWVLMRGARLRELAFVLICIIVYFAVLSIVGAAFAAGARYRFQINPFLFIFAAHGILVERERFRKYMLS